MSTAKRRSSPRLPGPASERWTILLAWLDHVALRSPPRDALVAWAVDRHQGSGEAYCSECLRTLQTFGLIHGADGVMRLTPEGELIRRTRDRTLLLDLSRQRIAGIEEMLRSAPGEWRTEDDHRALLRPHRLDWKSPSQVQNRLEWLMACGVAERDRGRWRIQPLSEGRP